MVKRLAKRAAFISPKTLLEKVSSMFVMWTLLTFYTVYFTVISAQSETCPVSCECSENAIKCVGRKLLHIPEGLPKNVTNLDLSGNSLSSFENNTFLEFSNLIELNLNDNDITDVSDLGNLPKSIQVLFLKGNKLKALNGNWTQFVILDFSRNKIESIDNETFKGIKNLTELYLSNNQIRKISPTALKDLPSLKILQLDGNDLAHLPAIECKSLQILDLSNNKLQTIKTLTFFKMVPSVEILKLSNNKITSLRTAAFTRLNVKHLYLNGNLLKRVVKDWTYGLETLEYLYLENNKIVNISTLSWKANCCRNLKYINLAHNNLERVLFKDDKNYGGHFMNLDALVTLNLSSNKIFDISERAFKSLQKLESLDLSNNQISIVEKFTFENLPTLEKLDMTNNPIVEVTQDTFTSLEKLRDLRMNSDMFYCSCKLRWFSKWLRTKRFSRSVGLKCNQPKKLRGIDFKSVPLKDLLCDRPEIIQHPKSHIAIKGEDVRFSCTVKNGSIEGIRILWQKDNKNIDMTESKVIIYTQVQDNYVYYKSILYLSNVTKAKDGGNYQCLVLAREERMPSHIANLRVFVPPKFTKTPGELVINVGDDVRFNCSASGDPQPIMSFRKEQSSRLLAVQDRRIGLDGNTFIIRNVSHSDVGLYRCFAKSKAGAINTTFTLNVIGKPMPVHEMLDKVALINDAAVFVCAAIGWPRLKYTWFKDGEVLDLTSNNLKLRREHNAQHLVVLHVGYSDAGEYKCRVSNSLGSVELISRLKVVKDLSEKPNSPDKESITHKTLIAAVIFTAACTMVVTALVCIAVLHAATRGRCTCLTRQKTSGTVTLDSFVATDPENREYVQMTENSPNESPRSSSTFVTSSDCQPHSDCNYLQTSSESGSSKEHRDGSYEGRHSSGVCSMNSSTSSLASTSNHRNTFPFSNTKTYFYPGTEAGLYDANNDVNSSRSTCGHPAPRQSLQLKYEQYYPARRKHKSRDKSSRPRDRHVNKRRKGAEQKRLQVNEPHEQQMASATDEYRTESEGTVL